jgi:site-specific DNA-methyltransferase (adenine-specific)
MIRPDNSLLEGDCLDIMPTLADKSIDMTVTSPPYDNLRTYNGSLVWNFEIFQKIAKELYRVTKDGGVVVWVVGDATIKGSETGTSFKQALYFKETGFNLHDTMIFAKNNYIPLTHNRYEQQFEYMFILSKGQPQTFNPLMKTNKQVGRIKGGTFNQDGNSLSKRHKDVGVSVQSIAPNIFFYNVGMMNSSKDRIAFRHPAIFPEQLASDHIISWSNEGDTVLDPFAGSGTTGVACIRTNRKYILIEKDPKYCEIIRKRIAEHEPLLRLI